jgi:hemerythrin-like domain-containing protein
MTTPLTRRALLAAAAVALPLRALGAEQTEPDAEISPAEDLMREHGVLARLLLVYEAALPASDASPAHLPVVVQAAELVRRFIEDYHEKLEEDFVFPRFEAADRLRPLVRTLRTQHDRGRSLTDDILRLARGGGAAAVAAGSPLRTAVGAFVRMYRPHAAREDTVLFPAFHPLLSDKDYDRLGEQFEDREHALFGAAGFHGIVAEVAALETSLGIGDLNHFTPP